MAIQLVDFTPQRARAIEQFAASGASSVELAHGTGESHAYAIHFVPGGAIGPHPAGFDQLFLVVQGSGWHAGGEDFGVAPRHSDYKATQLRQLDRSSGELWFWGPQYAGP